MNFKHLPYNTKLLTLTCEHADLVWNAGKDEIRILKAPFTLTLKVGYRLNTKTIIVVNDKEQINWELYILDKVAQFIPHQTLHTNRLIGQVKYHIPCRAFFRKIRANAITYPLLAEINYILLTTENGNILLHDLPDADWDYQEVFWDNLGTLLMGN